MVKKQKQDAVPTAQSAPNRDVIQRLNFSYQASVFMANLAASSTITTDVSSTAAGSIHDSATVVKPAEPASQPGRQPQRKKRRRARQVSVDELGRKWAEDVKAIGKKTTVRIDPSVKRTICERCSTVFIPGQSVSVRVKGSASHKHVVVYTCFHCSSSLRIIAPPTLPGPTLAASPKTVPSKDLEVQAAAKEQNAMAAQPRQLPSFARSDADHAVFEGDQKLELEESKGTGVFAV